MTEVEVKLQAVKLERKSKWIRVALKLYHYGGRGGGWYTVSRKVGRSNRPLRRGGELFDNSIVHPLCR